MTASQLSLLDAPARLRTFEDVLGAVMARGRGITLRELGTADALGRELASDHPNPERLGWLCRRLGLDPRDLEVCSGCTDRASPKEVLRPGTGPAGLGLVAR